jgi:hypothetical protein
MNAMSLHCDYVRSSTKIGAIEVVPKKKLILPKLAQEILVEGEYFMETLHLASSSACASGTSENDGTANEEFKMF